MGLLHSLSIAKRLRWIVTSAITLALVLASLAFLVYDYYTFRADKTKDVQTLAEVIGSNSTGALAFQDTGTAKEILKASCSDPRPHGRTRTIQSRRRATTAAERERRSSELHLPRRTLLPFEHRLCSRSVRYRPSIHSRRLSCRHMLAALLFWLSDLLRLAVPPELFRSRIGHCQKR